MIIWDPNKAIDIGRWSTCGGGRLERFYCTCLIAAYLSLYYVNNVSCSSSLQNRQVGVDKVIALRSLGSVMVSMLV